jgi:hypothetical protein
MKMVDRVAVEGTRPTIHIGHRTYRAKKTGKIRVSSLWYAEYCINSHSHYETLKTTSKVEAIRRAHKIVDRLESGEARPPARRPELREVATAYLDLQRSRGRAPKTMEKYEMVALRRLVPWAEANGYRFAATFNEKAFWALNGVLLQEGLTEKTRYGYLTVVKQLCKWAAGPSVRLIPTNLLAGVHLEESAELWPSTSPATCATPSWTTSPRQRTRLISDARSGLAASRRSRSPSHSTVASPTCVNRRAARNVVTGSPRTFSTRPTSNRRSPDRYFRTNWQRGSVRCTNGTLSYGPPISSMTVAQPWSCMVSTA